LRINKLRELLEEFYLLASPLLKAVRPGMACTVQLTNSAAGPGRKKQLNPA
jgi:hypothetical protein